MSQALPTGDEVRAGLAVLPRGLGGRLERLAATTAAARELAAALRAHLGDYERELVISALYASRSGHHGDGSGSASVKGRFEARIGRLDAIADELGELVVGLVEDLRARFEACELEAARGAAGPDLRTRLEAYERELILSALRACGNNQKLAARRLGVLPTTLNEKMKRLDLREPARRSRLPRKHAPVQFPESRRAPRPSEDVPDRH